MKKTPRRQLDLLLSLYERPKTPREMAEHLCGTYATVNILKKNLEKKAWIEPDCALKVGHHMVTKWRITPLGVAAIGDAKKSPHMGF